MKLVHEAIRTKTFHGVETDLDQKIAYHLAGQAVAIYLGNKQKQLPAVHFTIEFKQGGQDQLAPSHFRQADRESAKISGGRLIQSLPVSYAEATVSLSWYHQAEYRCAFEADVSNLLSGPLAEAKFVALQDGEAFNPKLIHLRALQNYGGHSALESANEYMECFMHHKAERKQKLAELYMAAFNFVNTRANWRKISALAEFILGQPEDSNVIHCEDVISLLDNMTEVPICQLA